MAFESQPWWVYALLAFIPFCIFLAFREIGCWFFKTNASLRKFEKLEQKVIGLQNSINNLQKEITLRSKTTEPDLTFDSNEK